MRNEEDYLLTFRGRPYMPMFDLHIQFERIFAQNLYPYTVPATIQIFIY